MPRALLSVSDKRDLVPFARELAGRGWTLFSTGGTARALREAGVPVTDVSELTGHPEILGGRVKTLHPAVHAGLLARARHPADEREMREHGYLALDLVAVNLYPFRETIERPGVELEEAVEEIDVGGPTMLRSAAKNHDRVWVVVDPDDYAGVLARLDDPEPTARPYRRALAAKVFDHVSSYDRAIAGYLGAAESTEERAADAAEALPAGLELRLRRVQPLRYGENPDQRAALYAAEAPARGLAAMRQLQGKELSFNNLLDVDAAWLAASAWRPDEAAACAIVKHTTPCGLAVAGAPAEAYLRALATDPTSAFGSVVAFNVPVDAASAEAMRSNFVEAVVAPGFHPAAVERLSTRRNLRLVQLSRVPDEEPEALDFKRVRGGFLVQEPLRLAFPEDGWTVVTRREPEPREWEDLRFAWRAVAMVKSNAILVARGGSTLGIGAGQMSRVDASRIAVMKAADAGLDLKGSALASDAFFPFRDGVDAAAVAGVSAIVQPGGSVRDAEVIAAADQHGIAMVFTGRRLFRH